MLSYQNPNILKAPFMIFDGLPRPLLPIPLPRPPSSYPSTPLSFCKSLYPALLLLIRPPCPPSSHPSTPPSYFPSPYPPSFHTPTPPF